MEYLTDIIQETLHNFDFSYCIVVNILTYLIIKQFDINKTKRLSTWHKRAVLTICILFIGGLYYTIGSDFKILLNSAILAPVSWSWIFKPLCNNFNIDYKKFNV